MEANMEILDFLKQNADAFSGIENAASVIDGVVSKMKELGYTALANNTKEPAYINKVQFDQVNGQVGELNKQLETLKGSAKGNEELLKKIEELQKVNSEWDGKYKNSVLENSIKLAAMKAKANDAGDVLALVDKSKLNLKDDGSIEGLDEQIKTLSESKAYLFNPVTSPGGANPAGNQVTETQKVATDFAAALG